MVDLFAETAPPDFGFSDTAFRVSVLLASRRLSSDRFFTTDYTPAVYTPEGMRWIDDNPMSTVLLRHCPELEPFLTRVENAVAPWIPAAQLLQDEMRRTVMNRGHTIESVPGVYNPAVE